MNLFRNAYADQADRFWDKVDATGDCWEWIGYRHRTGYGVARWEQRRIVAHRVAYQLLVGPIPGGLELDHLCRNRACVNPDHMEPVTAQVNTSRSYGIAARRAAVTHCPRGHEYTPENTYRNPRLGFRNCRACRVTRRDLAT